MKRTIYPDSDVDLIRSMQKGISIPGADLRPDMSNFAVEYAITGDIENAIKVSGIQVPVLRKNREPFLRDLISDPEIQAVMQSIRQDKTITHLITHEKIQHEYAKIAFVDPAECFSERGGLLSIRDMPHYVRSAISEVKHSKTVQGEGADQKITYNTIIKFHNKMEALKILDQPNLNQDTDIPVYQDNRKIVNINVQDLSSDEMKLASKLIDDTSSIHDIECFESIGAGE